MSSPILFPRPQAARFSGESVKLCGIRTVSDTVGFLPSFLHALRHPAKECAEGNLTLLLDTSLPAEGYRIEARETGIKVWAADLRGAVYAGATLSQLLDSEGFLPSCEIEDAPYMAVRGIHSYLPPADGIGEFCRILDALAHLKYNTLILEIGGGVAYDSHPEVNAAWTKFCREGRDHPGGPQGLQGSEIYWKDSTHVELAGGGVLTKPQLMEIIDHARSLGMEVIPEIQALSHSYYLTLAHRDIAEQPYERWPDTYCPMNEKSYALYFDLARELHELIGFSQVSIGHDEIRVLGSCPVCRQYTGHELLAYEINKLHAFYKTLGVSVCMWGEGLQNFKMANGKRMGDPVILSGRYGRKHCRPASHEAIDSIPRDILMLDWCYTSSYRSEDEFTERGFREIYGNFQGTVFSGWEERSRRENVIGAEVSTWCVADENENGRNGWFFEQAFSASVLWREDFDNSKRAGLMEETAARMPLIRAIIRGEDPKKTAPQLFFPADGHKASEIDLAATPDYARAALSALSGSKVAYGISCEEISVTVNGRFDRLSLLYAADFKGRTPFSREYTWYFRDRGPRILAYCSIEYTDGLVTSLPIELGYNIGSLQGSFETDLPAAPVKRAEDENVASGDAPSPADAEDFFTPTMLVPRDPWIGSVAYFTDPLPLSLDGEEAMLYAWSFPNPRPEARISKLTLYPARENVIPIRLYGAWGRQTEA